MPRLLSALDYRCAAAPEIVLAGSPGRPDFESLHDAVFAHPGLNRVVAHADRDESLASVVAARAVARAREGPALAYVCRDFSCRKPTSSPAELARALDG